MSTLEIDVPATRTAVVGLRGVVAAAEATRRGVVSAALLAGLGAEHEDVLTTLDELRDEVALTGQVLGLAADQAEAADSTYAGMLGGWLSSSLLALRDSINDPSAASVRSLLGSGTVIPPDLAAALTPGAAATWLASLPDDVRVALAADADRFDGTGVGAAIDRWMATLEGAPLRAVYIARALLHAGIDMAAWDPTLGLAPNAATVEAVYEYYGQLYRDHPDRLWWSGMAALIGPSFYGGFQDLETFRSLFDVAGAVAGSPLGVALPPGVAASASLGSDVTAAELLWYQVQLLSMQREIFVDMAAAHEAYLDGGVSTIERFYVGDPYGFEQPTVDAWRAVDEGWRTGDPELIAAGNELLLRREQQRVIANDYGTMRSRPLTGEVVTWAMTLVGAPSVPGALSYPEVFPLTVDLSPTIGTPDHLPLFPTVGPWSVSVPLPHVEVEAGADLVTPLPAGNIADFDDRWALIQQDTLPTYVELARDRPDVVLDELATPVGERAEAFTIQHRIDDILVALTTDWSLDPELEISVGW